jgi:hypothetical protein
MKTTLIVCVLTLLYSTAHSAQVTLANIPSYSWYNGCGPTAAASIFGYYDLNGYGNLFEASGWDQIKLTKNVQNEISSDAHNQYYNPAPDIEPPSDYVDTSIADFFHTSEDRVANVEQTFGWSYLFDAPGAFMDYAAYKGYMGWNAYNTTFSSFSFEKLVEEIDEGSPLLFLVDYNSDGFTDHFVPVFGYDDTAQKYACYYTGQGTEDEIIYWYDYTEMEKDNPWGVGFITIIEPGPMLQPGQVPEPSTALLLGTGLALVAGRKRRNTLRKNQTH